MLRARIRRWLWLTAGGLLSMGAWGSVIPSGYVIYSVTNPGISAEFDIINQTGPNSSNDATWPILTPVSLLNLRLTVEFSSGLPMVFGPSYFSLSSDGFSLDGGTIPIDGANPQPTRAILTGTFMPTAVTLFDGTTDVLEPVFVASIFPSAGTTLQDQDLALVSGISSVPEPGTWVLLLSGAGGLLICHARGPGKVRRLLPRVGGRPIVVLLCCLLAINLVSPAARASTPIKLNRATSPGTGLAGVTRVSVTGSGFSSAVIVPGNVTVSLAASCYGVASAVTPALSVKTVVAGSRVIQFQIPAALAPNTYYVSVSGTDSGGGVFVSSNCSQLIVTGDTTITQCREITAPGSYSLTGNLVQPQVSTAFAPCLAIHDTNNVQLDCKSHTIAAATGGLPGVPVSITNVQNFSLRNCTLEAPNDLLVVRNSSDGVIDGNTLGNLASQRLVSVSLVSVSGTVVSNNIIDAAVIQNHCSGNTIRFNKATCPVWTNARICGALFTSILGSNNTFDSNEIDGKSGVEASQYGNGADDGIVIQDESGDVLANNIIRNAWDAGIETSGNIVNTEILSNSIINVPVGIGGWYWNSWRNVSVINNTVDGANMLFQFYRLFGLRPANWWDGVAYQGPADTAVYFEGNLFSGNQFVNPLPTSRASVINVYNYFLYFMQSVFYQGGPIAGTRIAQPSDFKLNNNTFTRNNFGHNQPPPSFFMSPLDFSAGYIIDGGGNICAPQLSPYPLVCN
jgi:hypothetical protein